MSDSSSTSAIRRPAWAIGSGWVLAFMCAIAGWRLFGLLPAYRTSHDILQPPGGAYWLGTNDLGQDVLVGLLRGLPNTILVPVVVAAATLLISGCLAALAATRGGFVQALILRTVEVLQVLPSMFVLLLLAAWMRPGFPGVVILLTLTSWHDDIRVLRAIFLREMTRESLHYARINGAGWAYCFRRHLLPSMWPAVMAIYVQNVRGGIMKVAGLGFLGIIDPRLTNWGGMMQDGLAYLYGPAWLWLLLPPALALSLFIGVLILAGQNLEERSLANPTSPR